jgi:hypothetical protein
MLIIKAILDGERDKQKLLSLCDRRVQRAKGEEVLKALEGYYHQSGLFALRQAYEGYHFYQDQIRACDGQIEQTLMQINAGKDLDKDSDSNRKPIRHNKPTVNNLGEHMLKAFDGRDATKLSGITDYTSLKLLSEIGTDLNRWPTEKHFTSWLGLSPGQNNSGKKKRSVSKGNPKAGEIFREIAQSLLNSRHLAWGAFARRLKARKGPAIAIKATARKLAAQYWRLMVKGSDFVERGVQHYQAMITQQKHQQLRRLALELNVEIRTD